LRFPVLLPLSFSHSLPTRRSSDLAEPNGVYADRLQDLEPLLDAACQRGRAERTEIVVKANTFDDDAFAVELESGVDVELDGAHADRKSTRLNSSHVAISYAVFCLK